MFRLFSGLFRRLNPMRGLFRGFRFRSFYRPRYRIGGGVDAAAQNWLNEIILDWSNIDYLQGMIISLSASPRAGQPFLKACVRIVQDRITELEMKEEMNKIFRLFGF